MTKDTFQIQISLKGSKPKIWRRVLIPSDLLLSDLHIVIQITMGWTDTHLHLFSKNHLSYAPRLPDDMFGDNEESIDYKKIKVSDLLTKEKEKMVYEYDFGDDWQHDIILEKILPGEELKKAICIDGKRGCPPEDCGGVPIYQEILKILRNPAHEEYESYMEWLEEGFDPEYFDIEEVNEVLNSIKFRRRR